MPPGRGYTKRSAVSRNLRYLATLDELKPRLQARNSAYVVLETAVTEGLLFSLRPQASGASRVCSIRGRESSWLKLWLESPSTPCTGLFRLVGNESSLDHSQTCVTRKSHLPPQPQPRPSPTRSTTTLTATTSWTIYKRDRHGQFTVIVECWPTKR